MRKINVCKMFLLVLILMSACAGSAHAARRPGRIVPSFLEMQVGASANITCLMNPSVFPGRNSADLHIFDSATQKRVPEEQVVRLNNTAIVFMLRKAVQQQAVYVCKCGSDAIMEAKVYVGTAPQRVRDFHCRSYDFEYLVCNFTQPENPILTQYNLSYYLHSPSYIYYPLCNYEDKPLVVCNTTLDPRLDDFKLHMTLSATNSLSQASGPEQQNFEVNLLEVTIPAVPGAQFQVERLASDAITVRWSMPNGDLYPSKGLRWEVLLQPQGMETQDLSQVITVKSLQNSQHLEIAKLPFAYYWYELRLRVRVRSLNAVATDATGSSDLWSQPFTYRFRTLARLPDRPPRTNVGSFYVDSTETHVRLYWEQLEPFEQNGPNFSYTISKVVRNGKTIELQPLHLELNSALYAWQKDAHYEFEIRSCNSVGVSKEASRIEIVALAQRNQKAHSPPAIHNVYHAYNRTNVLTWEAPEQTLGLRNYTVFWCYSKQASQNECKGSIHFQEVDGKTLTYTTAPQPALQDHTLNLAVSANYLTYNTGMHWSPCTMDVNSELVKMQPEVQATSALSLKVQWGLEHICLSILAGYNLTYCELDNDNTSTANCVLDTIQSFELDKSVRKTEIKQLKPYTLYKVQMYMFNKLKVGKISEPVYRRTFEAAPSPPRQVQVTDIRQTSAVVYWLPPSQINGHVRFYNIHFNERSERLFINSSMHYEDIIDAQGRLSYTLHDLTSFKSYKVYVTAHSVESSLHSNDVHFTTLIGVPSKPGPASRLLNTHNGSTLIEWSKPSAPAGRLEYYEVAVTLKRHEQVLERQISVVMDATSCLLGVPQCTEPELETTVEVRAVNAALLSHEVAEGDVGVAQYSWDKHDFEHTSFFAARSERLSCLGGQQQNLVELLGRYQNGDMYRLYKSDWQLGPTYGCAENLMSTITATALLIVVCFVVMLGVCWAARKQYNKMANIKCTLPAGLGAYMGKDGFPTADFLGSTNNVASVGISEECLSPPSYQHNEKHHLLEAMSQDFHSQSAVSVSGSMPLEEENEERMHAPSQYFRTFSQSTADTFVLESPNDETDVEFDGGSAAAEAENAYVQLTRRTAAALMSKYMAPPFATFAMTPADRNVQANKLMDLALQQQQQLQKQKQQEEHDKQTAEGARHIEQETEDSLADSAQPQVQLQHKKENEMSDERQMSANSGYVAVDSLNALPPQASNNGYVQPAQVPALLTNTLCNRNAPTTAPAAFTTPSHAFNTPNAPASHLSGYTALDALCKVPRSTQNAEVSHTNPAISGYVTQRQLNAFGQQQHN